MTRTQISIAVLSGLFTGVAMAQAVAAPEAPAPGAAPAPPTAAAPAAAAVVGRIKRVSGTVHVERSGQRLAASPGMPLQRQDRIVTGKPGTVGIVLADDTALTAGADTQIELADVQFDNTTHAGKLFVRLLRGAMHVVTGLIARESPKDVRIETPTAVMGVRGTEFIVDTAGGG